MSKCFIFHDWGKWEQYQQRMIALPTRRMPREVQGTQIPYVETWQKRTCNRCGKMQDEEVKGS